MRWTLRIHEMITALLPWFLRKPVINAYMQALCTPIGDVNSELVSYASESLYRVAITGQVIYLERLLNDLFDNTLRRIYITDFSLQGQAFVYQRAENETTFAYLRSEIDVLYIYTRAELLENYRFAVMIPEELYSSAQLDVIHANLRLHKTAGTSYILISI
jgi:hypothetical protein